MAYEVRCTISFFKLNQSNGIFGMSHVFCCVKLVVTCSGQNPNTDMPNSFFVLMHLN